MGKKATRTPLARVIYGRGIRVNYFAESVMGCSKYQLSQYAAGARPAPRGWFERAAVALGVSVESILPPKPTTEAA